MLLVLYVNAEKIKIPANKEGKILVHFTEGMYFVHQPKISLSACGPFENIY